MQRRIIKFPIILIICQMLLIGCGRHISPEEQSAEEQMLDVSDNTVTSISENAEINDTSEETAEPILTSIEGVWEVDKYIGFIPFKIYESGMWDGNAGTEEERRAVYEEEKEQAVTELPDFYFEIRENDADAELYIYVTNDNRTYASPVNIVISDSAADDEYSLFVHRTVEGLDLSEKYPLTYIEFNSFVCSEEENKIIYEPATLILTADEQFLLLKDGAFYSLEHSMQIEIMSGDFSGMTDVEFRETVEQQYQWWEESRAIEEMEWRQVDLNGDRIDDLILQEVQTVGESQQHRIVAIFACEGDNASCILWDLNDSTEYTFCGPTGELMYYVDGWGTSIGFASYRHCYYDREWNRLADYVLVVTVVDSSMDGSREEFLEYNSNWIEGHPDMAEDGYYYSRYEIDMESGEQKEREALTFEGFREIFEEVMGMEYYSFR